MTRNTLLWLVVALASSAGAYMVRPVEVAPATYEDTNEPLFASFTDPSMATSLEVRTWDSKDAQLSAFKVEMQDGLWVIPSHHNYPADGVEQMGKSAASFVGLRKDIVRSDDVREHGEFGVKDPDNNDAKDEERGQRIILKDASGMSLVDVIVGKEVPQKPGYRYLRYADQNRVYAVKMALDVSTSFADWIEKDLLRLDSEKIVAVESNSYRVDERTGRVLENRPLLFKKSSDGQWDAEDASFVPAGKRVKSSAILGLVNGGDRLKIVGIRPQPAKLDTMSLLSKGFFYSPEQQQLFGNEGQVRLIADDGVVYTLYFGEITSQSGLALTAGGAPVQEKEQDAKDSQDSAKKGENRYMFVVVSYDPTFDSGKADDAQPEGEGSTQVRGEERATRLRARFDKWFYVIPDSSFTQLHKQPEELLEDLPAEPTAQK